MLSIYEQIIKAVKKSRYTGLYFLQGQEANYYIQKVIDYITAQEKDRTTTLHLRSYYAKQDALQEIIMDAQQQAIDGAKKIIIIKDADKLPSLRNSSGRKLLIDYLNHPSEHALLLFVYNDKPMPANTSLTKLLNQQKRLFTCKTPYTNQLPAWIQAYLKEREYTITPQALTTLQSLTTHNLQVLSRAIDKLLINLPQGHTLQEHDILNHIQSTKTYTLFDLQQALSTKDSQQVYTIVNYLVQHKKKHPLPYIIIYLTNFYTKLLKLQHRPTKDEQAITHLLQLPPYLTRIYIQASKHYKLAQTLQAIHALHHADLQFKGINYPSLAEEAMLRELVAKLLTPYTLPPLPTAYNSSQ